MVKKGFAAMSKERRKQVAKQGGAARVKKGDLDEAGKRGGEVTKAIHGRQHYSTIGKKGGRHKKKRLKSKSESYASAGEPSE